MEPTTRKDGGLPHQSQREAPTGKGGAQRPQGPLEEVYTQDITSSQNSLLLCDWVG